jgi:hypothetical protein
VCRLDVSGTDCLNDATFFRAARDLISLSERSGQQAQPLVLPWAFVVLEQRVAAFYNFKNENVAVPGSVIRIGSFGTCE